MRKFENARVLREVLKNWGGTYPIKFTYTDSVNGLRCRMYLNGFLVGSCGGGGYDMRGTCLGEFLTNAFKGELEALWERVKDQSERPYGMYEGGYVDGACGINCMIEIAGMIGLEVWWDCASERYWIRKKEG